MCLSGTDFVQMLEVNCSPGFCWIFLCENYHSAAPLSGSPDGYFGQDSHLDVVVELLFDSLLPVERDWERFVKGHRLGVLVCEKFHWRRILHER